MISRLWHTACLGQEGEVMVFGGSKDDLLFMDTVSKLHKKSHHWENYNSLKIVAWFHLGGSLKSI